MKFSVTSNELISAVNKVIGVTPTRSTLPILGNILFSLEGNELTLTGSDLEVYIKVVMNVNGKQNGSVAVPAKKLETLIQNLLDKDLNIELQQNFKVIIKTKGGRWSITGEDPNDFPLSAEIENAKTIELDNYLLTKYLSRAVHAASHDELRRSMNGIFFEVKSGELRVVSTDGHRLVRIIKSNFDYEGDRFTMLVPIKTSQMIIRLYRAGSKGFDSKVSEGEEGTAEETAAEESAAVREAPSGEAGLPAEASAQAGQPVTVNFNNEFLQCIYNNITITSRLIDDTFPNYESVIPTENEKVLKVDKKSLIASLKRSIIMSDQVTNRTSLLVNAGELKVKSANNEFGTESEETIDCNYTENEEFEIAFNGKYLLEAVQQFESDEIMFYFSTPLKAALLRPSEAGEEEDLMMLVMPVRNI